MNIQTAVNAVSTQNAAGTYTNAFKLTFTATTSSYAIEAQLVPSTGQPNPQQMYRIWFQESSISGTASTLAPQFKSPKCLEVNTDSRHNNTVIIKTDAIAAMGTYLYGWVEMPSVTASGGTLSVFLIEMN